MVVSAASPSAAAVARRWQQSDIDYVAAKLVSERRCVALTGAGVSKGSGIPTYRDAVGGTGLWDGSALGVLAFGTPLGFLFAPALAWRHYCERLLVPIRAAKPNPAHAALAGLEALLPDFAVVTQNVDGLHQRAGSTQVVELHGSVASHRHAWLGTDVAVPAGPPDPESPPAPFARPDVVMFLEQIPLIVWLQAESLVDEMAPGDVLLVACTSCAVVPAATLPATALLRGATVVEINPEPTLAADGGDDVVHLAGDAGQILAAVAERVAALLGDERPP